MELFILERFDSPQKIRGITRNGPLFKLVKIIAMRLFLSDSFLLLRFKALRELRESLFMLACLILESLDSFLKVRDNVILLDSLLLCLIDSKL